MKISSRLIISFLAVSGFIAMVGVISLYEISKISDPINNELSQSIEELSITSELDSSALLIRYYDEVLTQSARNYANTGDKTWQIRYLQTEPLLLEQISFAIDKGNAIEKKFFESVSFANDELVKLEYQSMELTDQGKNDQSLDILTGNEYSNYKQIYETNLRNYIEERGFEYDNALVGSTDSLQKITESIQNKIDFGIWILILLVLITIIASITLGIFISHSITFPMKKLQNAAKQITVGKFDTKVPLEGDFETKQLAYSFNDMTRSLKQTILLERKLAKAENDLKNERFSTIGELSSMIVHDIKNPLSIIKMNLEILTHKQIEDGDKIKNNIESMQSALNRVHKQIDEITNFVKITPLELETIFVHDLTDLLITSILKPDNITINFTKNDFLINCDVNRFGTVLQNLINNAIEVIGDNKGIIDIQFIKKEKNVIVKIIDSGPGISDENLEKIFEPLFTTKTTGTGLGLASCKNIIDQHKGEISVTNFPTTFAIIIPNEINSDVLENPKNLVKI